MKAQSPREMRPSSSLTSRLLWLTAVVLVVPWLGVQSLGSMKAFLLEGQEQAQLLSAQGIAALLSERPGLFADAPEAIPGFADLPLYPHSGAKVIDGYSDDWQALAGFRQRFGEAGDTPEFTLLLAEDRHVVYGLVEVADKTPVSRNPAVTGMDRSDHLRFYLRDRDGGTLRLLVAFEGNGPAMVYRMDERWRTARTVEYRLRAQVNLHATGYTVEFRFPLAWLGARRQLGLAAVDVTDPVTRQVGGISATFPRGAGETFNPVITRSPQMEGLLRSFSRDNARLWILDDHNRVRAIVGALQRDTAEQAAPASEPWWQLLSQRFTGWLVGMTAAEFDDFDAATVHSRNDAIYQRALAGEPGVGRRRSLDDRAEIVTAAHPIAIDGTVVGVLLLEKSTRHILQLQRRSLETLAGLTVGGMLVVSLLLLAFAYRLTWRIKRLASDAAANVDEFGRFLGGRPLHGVRSGDEIGMLAGTVDRMLGRLRQHQAFLTSIPRTLRHEINNPLNTVSTSLDSIDRGEDPAPYLESARRGLGRIGHVVNSLAEAANLEQALKAEELAPLDLAALLRLYVRHQAAQPGAPLTLEAPAGPVMVAGCGEHLEEALDKLLDNARDFAAADGAAIEVALTEIHDTAVLSVTNRGPRIAAGQMEDLFQFMSSGRAGSHGQHFGLGLYIARVIVEHHRGRISAENLADGSGVRVTVRLPKLDESVRMRETSTNRSRQQ